MIQWLKNFFGLRTQTWTFDEYGNQLPQIETACDRYGYHVIKTWPSLSAEPLSADFPYKARRLSDGSWQIQTKVDATSLGDKEPTTCDAVEYVPPSMIQLSDDQPPTEEFTYTYVGLRNPSVSQEGDIVTLTSDIISKRFADVRAIYICPYMQGTHEVRVVVEIRNE